MNSADATYRRTNVTYRQLHQALRALGVTRRLTEEHPQQHVYEHTEFGLLTALAAYPETDRVLDYHLAGLRMLLDQFGIASPKVFDSELQKAG